MKEFRAYVKRRPVTERSGELTDELNNIEWADQRLLISTGHLTRHSWNFTLLFC